MKSELTEASATGALLSIVAGIFILYLVFSQISEYRTLKSETQVMLDHYSHMNSGGMDDEDTLQINFNFSFPHLSCEYASVDATNFMGTHDAGIAARVSKIHLDKMGRQLGPHKDRKETKHATEETPHEGDVKSVSLTVDTFETERKKHDIIIVNFFTPWCHWCQKLEPVWEKAAAKMVETHPGDERLILGKVDCTSDKAEALCTNLKIDAFPTIMVFRRDDLADREKERYHGERTVDAITGWANELMKQIKSEVPKSRVVDTNKDGEKDSHNGVGCMVLTPASSLMLKLIRPCSTLSTLSPALCPPSRSPDTLHLAGRALALTRCWVRRWRACCTCKRHQAALLCRQSQMGTSSIGQRWTCRTRSITCRSGPSCRRRRGW